MVLSNSFGGFRLRDSNLVRQARDRYRYDQVPELAHANSLYVASGKWPTRGWLLMLRSDYNRLNPFTQYNLVIQDYGKKAKVAANPPITFQNLVIVQARCVSRGVAADPNAVYLIEVTDQRGLLWNRWFEFPTNTEYNGIAPAYPGQYYSASLNAGTPWTWSQMIGSLWGQMPGLGVYPGLPIVPVGTPEGWTLPGVGAWEALNLMLSRLSLVISVDMTKASPYGITRYGTSDNVALIQQYAGFLEDDWEYLDPGLGRVPLNVVVYFHRRNQYYGTEETVRNDALQWSSTPLYSVAVTGPYPNATGTHFIWSDFTVRYDVDNNPLVADIATANAIANDLVTDYFARITRQTQGFLHQQYIGAIPFTVGGAFDGVCWRHDYKEGRKGWVTECVRGPSPPFPDMWDGFGF